MLLQRLLHSKGHPHLIGQGHRTAYGDLLVRGTRIRIGDNTYVYDNKIYLPNDLEGWWIDKTRRMIGTHYFLENYLTGHTVEVLDHGSRRRPPRDYGHNE